jgi:nucleolar pre-ribosomal-associated protein 1
MPSPARDENIGLLQSLFKKHPSSTCHPSHVIPLLGVYRGTLDQADTQVLSTFELFEKSRQMSTLAILCNWTPEPSYIQPKDLLETICNFDSVLMFRTCASFPQRRDPQIAELGTDASRGDIYDPNFVLPLLAALMVSDEPITSMQWVDLCRTNVLSLAVSSLSSKRLAMRQLGYASLATANARLPVSS